MNNRVKRLQAHLTQPLLVVKKENLLYLTGHSFISGYLLVTKKELVFFGDGLEHPQDLPSDSLKNIKKYLRSGTSLLIEHYIIAEELEGLKNRLQGLKLKTSPSPIDVLRIIKSSEEIKSLEQVHKITAAVFAIAKKQLKKKQWTERGLAQYLRIWGLELGADEVSFDPIVAVGANAAIPHHKPGSKILKPGETIILDFGFKVNGYCSDFSRTVFLRKVSTHLDKIYKAVQIAQDVAIKELKAGMTGKTIDALARDYLKKHNLHQHFIHSLGHGTGLEVHEAPGVGPYSKTTLKNGMVFSVEPGVYLTGQAGVRIEDLVYLKNGRANYFVKVSNKLKDNIIK